jgi:hypothetical protein
MIEFAEQYGRLLLYLCGVTVAVSSVALLIMLWRIAKALVFIAREVSFLNHRFSDATRSLMSIEARFESDEIMGKRKRYSGEDGLDPPQYRASRRKSKSM